MRRKFMIYEFCKQGTVFYVVINKAKNYINIYNECDSVWYEENEAVKVTNFDCYMASKQLPSLWSKIAVLNESKQF